MWVDKMLDTLCDTIMVFDLTNELDMAFWKVKIKNQNGCISGMDGLFA